MDRCVLACVNVLVWLARAVQVSERARRRLLAAVERAKCTLSVVTTADIEVRIGRSSPLPAARR